MPIEMLHYETAGIFGIKMKAPLASTYKSPLGVYTIPGIFRKFLRTFGIHTGQSTRRFTIDKNFLNGFVFLEIQKYMPLHIL